MPGNDAPRTARPRCPQVAAGNGAFARNPTAIGTTKAVYSPRLLRHRSDGFPSTSFGRRRRVFGARRRNTCRRIAVTPLLIPRRTVQTAPTSRHLIDARTAIRRPRESPDFGRTTGDRPRYDKTYFLPTATMTSLCLRGRPPSRQTVLIPGNLAK
jgi:hypothetical protein